MVVVAGRAGWFVFLRRLRARACSKDVRVWKNYSEHVARQP